MHRLLIVDDEPIIVDGLVQLFEERTNLDLCVYKAYSAFEALDIVKKAKIDIVLSDINMPKMNGLQMLDEILKYWPRCKAIFLTGYSQFDFVYSAIKKNSVDYILKTEGDEAITESIEKTLNIIIAEETQKRELELSINQKKIVNPLLRKSLIEGVLLGEQLSNESINERLKELEINLNPKNPAILVCGEIDRWLEVMSYAQKMEIISAIQQNLLELIGKHTYSECVAFENSRLVWLLQPVENGLKWDELKTYIKATLEVLQNNCKDIFRVEISFAISKENVEWNMISEEFDYIVRIMENKSLSGQQLIIDLAVPSEIIKLDITKSINSNKEFNDKISDLEYYLYKLMDNEVEQLCRQIIQDIREGIKENYLVNLERFYTLMLTLIKYINKENINGQLTDFIDVGRILMMDLPIKWDNAEKVFVGLGRLICMYKNEQSNSNNDSVIERIHEYINNNISRDLSLAKLAEIVYFNSSYLSRFYKQMTGSNLSQYINDVKTEYAKQLLRSEEIKISEISVKLGFEAPSCFTAFFKKMTRFTPQEYRDANSIANTR